METKLKAELNSFEVIDFIQRDMAFNRRIAFSDMIEYLKGELHIYLKTDDIAQTDSTYRNRFGQEMRITTLACKNVKAIIREKITDGAEVRFVSVDATSGNAEEDDAIEEL